MAKQTIGERLKRIVASVAVARLFRILFGNKKRTMFAAAGGLAVVVALVGAWPRTITFSYAQPSCTNTPVVAPGVFRTANTENFELAPEGGIKLGSLWIATTTVCALPKSIPKQGEYRVSLAPFGIEWLGKTVTVRVAEPPLASLHPLEKPIPVSKPLAIPLSDDDKIFTYQMKIGEATLDCPVEARRATCDVPKLALKQGSAYPVELARYFGDNKAGTIVAKQVQTLTAVTVSEASIKANETVYAKPKALQLKLDKPLTNAKARLIKVDGDKKEEITSKLVTDDTKIEVSWEKDLSRTSKFELRLDSVQARDGSTLVEPYILNFETSGGPKVTGINIGKSKVALGATAILTFDQPLFENQDITKAVQATGGAGKPERRGNQIAVSLAGVPKCGAFTITVTDTLLSNHEISGGSGWSHTGRTVCHSVGSIGVSAQGRPITAYYFGDGPTAAIYTGAIHGSEPSTRLLMLRWIDELEANPGNIPAGKSVVVIPAINPDGVARGQRTNANNVDLNRNFGTSDWKKDITTVNNKPFPGGGGSAPMSEPETRVIANFVALRRPQIVLSYHSIGGVVISNQVGNANARAATYVSLSRYGNATGQSSSTFDYSISGTADDYYGQKLGIPSMIIELGSHTYHQFERNRQAMWAMLK